VRPEQTIISPALSDPGKEDRPRGTTLPLLKDLEDCPDCDGDGDCFACGGTGKCSACDGDGETETSRAYCNALYWSDAMTQERCDRRAPKGASVKWQCPEHERQQAYIKLYTKAGAS
jgi:DnaJ-class molecular chaperone